MTRYYLFFFCFWTCVLSQWQTTPIKNATIDAARPLQQLLAARTTVDTLSRQDLEANWRSTPKILIGLDSLEATDFVLNHLEYPSYLKAQQVLIHKMDFLEDGIEELWVNWEDIAVDLYQKNENGDWQLIGEWYGDDIKLPEVVSLEQGLIKSHYWMSCSNCSDEGDAYEQVSIGHIKPLLHISTGFNYDYESLDDELELYEQANARGSFDLKTNRFEVNFDLEWSVLGTNYKFIDDHIQINYQLEEDTLKVLATKPAALLPYYKIGEQKRYYNQYNESDPPSSYPTNEIAWLAYLDYKRPALFQLKNKPQYQSIIQRLEKEQQVTWELFVQDWIESESFAAR